MKGIVDALKRVYTPLEQGELPIFEVFEDSLSDEETNEIKKINHILGDQAGIVCVPYKIYKNPNIPNGHAFCHISSITTLNGQARRVDTWILLTDRGLRRGDSMVISQQQVLPWVGMKWTTENFDVGFAPHDWYESNNLPSIDFIFPRTIH